MELKKLQEHWSGFPALSMEERPVLSSEMETMLVRNPFTADFYLRDKIIRRIIAGAFLFILSLFQLRNAFRGSSDGLYLQLLLSAVLAGFTGFHIHLLLFADYGSLASLRLIPFLQKIENTFSRYIYSFRILSLVAGFYLQALIGWGLRSWNNETCQWMWTNDAYRLFFITFLSVSVYIAFLHTRIKKYRRIMGAVRSYREGVLSAAAKKH